MDTASRTHLMVKVAKKYFELGMTQQEIAASLRISRSTVSRLLSRARNEGVVQINIEVPSGIYPELEKSLEQQFNLLEAIVISTQDYNSSMGIVVELGQAAAVYLERTIQNNDVIGFAWGTTMKAMVDAVQPLGIRGIKVFQMNGGLTPQMTDIHGTSLTHNLAVRLGGEAYMLQAPGVVESPQVQQIFMADPQVAQVFDLVEESTMAFMGIGTIAEDTLWGQAGLLSDEVTSELRSLGAVGDIMSRYFDKNGTLVNSSLCQRVVGIPIEKLQKIGRRIGVAGGRGKFEAIQGALSGGYVNVLITDQYTAEKLTGTKNQR
ncbi:MAG: sugar-binding transcriptional regulator [Anaerolineales bacterium]|nr:sugar-binding transcriptional regulator [Anaerolineales bacterium]